MKKYILLLAGLFSLAVSFAQLPQNPRPNELTTPKLKPLTPPDLKITGMSLISVTKDNAAKKLVIVVSVTIKNNGQLRAVNSSMKAYFTSPAGSASTRAIDGTVSVNAIDPGASITADYTFRRPFSGDAGYTLTRFDFRVKADSGNTVRESDESNNSSTTIQITPPAR